MKPAIGIDLGTTYFCVGVWQEGKVKIIINEEGNRTTPCYVAFMGDEQIVGDAAKNEAMMNPTNTVFDMKRLIGRDYDDQTIQNYLQQWPFKVVKEGGKPNLHMKCHKNVQRFNAEMISSMILTKIKEITDAFMGQEIRDAVITVPTYFNHCQRQATRNAGVKAGLNVMKIINEPIAAAFAYGLEKNLIGEKSVLIFDLGGATFDVSILTIDVDSVFEVKSKAGDMDLGGENFDSRLVDHFCKEFERKYGKNVKNNPRSLRKLRIAAERAKRTLSSSTEATIEIDALYEGIDFYTKVSRTRFEELCADLFRSILKLVKKALAAAKLDKRSIHDIVLVGGSTRIPKIQSMLQSFFCGKLLNLSINPEEAVAYGAAVHAAMLANENSLSSAFQDLRLVDVVPLSLGIETLGYFMNFIIRRKTKIPCSGTLPFTMNRDNERSMTFKIFEGERILTKYNNLLGEIKLTGITPALRGLSKINITFDIDADGILRVTAKDTASGSSNDIKITNCNKGRLRREEIDRMLDDADENEIENERERRRVVMRFELERYILNMGRAALNINKKSGRQLKTKVYNVLRETICWLNDHSSANALELGKVLLDFERVSWPIIREMYYLENGTNCILNVAVKDCDCVE